jgi:putative ABC transport system permease protein
VRLRARELAILRALGATPRANAAIVTSDGLTMIGLAITLGVPLGLAASARIWTPIANRAHVLVRVTSPWTWIVTLVLATVVAAGFVSTIPACRALRLRVADTLRVE